MSNYNTNLLLTTCIFSDFVVGSHESSQVVLFRTRPVMTIKPVEYKTFVNGGLRNKFKFTDNVLTVRICLNIAIKPQAVQVASNFGAYRACDFCVQIYICVNTFYFFTSDIWKKVTVDEPYYTKRFIFSDSKNWTLIEKQTYSMSRLNCENINLALVKVRERIKHLYFLQCPNILQSSASQ